MPNKRDRTKKYDGALATKNDILGLRKDIASFKDVVALKSDLKGIRSTMALKSDFEEIKSVMALKSDIKEVKDVMALKTDLVELKSDILEITRADTKMIVEDAVAELAEIVGNSFTRLEKNMDDKFDGVNNRINGLWNAFDAHTLDCVRRDEHDRLEKRVKVLEAA